MYYVNKVWPLNTCPQKDQRAGLRKLIPTIMIGLALFKFQHFFILVQDGSCFLLVMGHHTRSELGIIVTFSTQNLMLTTTHTTRGSDIKKYFQLKSSGS